MVEKRDFLIVFARKFGFFIAFGLGDEVLVGRKY
jgi:hypothetical protein